MFEFIWKDVIVIVVRCELMEWIRRKELISKKWFEKEMILLQTFLPPPVFCFERPFEKLFSLSANTILILIEIFYKQCDIDRGYAEILHKDILYISLILFLVYFEIHIHNSYRHLI